MEPIKEKLLGKSPENLDDAINEAIKLEIIEDDKKKKRNHHSKISQLADKEDSELEDMEDLEEDTIHEINKFRSHNGRQPYRRFQYRQQGRNGNQGNSGNGSSGNGNYRSGGASNGNFNRDMKCRYCKKPGHFQRYCRTRIARNAPMMDQNGKAIPFNKGNKNGSIHETGEKQEQDEMEKLRETLQDRLGGSMNSLNC